MKKMSRSIKALTGLIVSMSLFSATVAVATADDAKPLDRGQSELSLTIHKTTDEATPGQRKGIKGIQFTLTPITPTGNVGKIGTATWWQWAQSQKPTALSDAQAGQAISFAPTGDNGNTCLSSYTKDGCTVNAGIKQGLYLVKETGSTGTISGESSAKTFRPGLPFFVTLPLPDTANDAANSKWNYNPVVDPKNQLFNTKKTLTSVNNGKAVYTIQSTIPSTNMDYEDSELYPFGFEDLVPAGLTADTSGIKVYYANSDGSQAGTTLELNTDYKVTTATDSNPVADPSGLWADSIPQSNTGTRVLVYFTKAGAAKLKTAGQTTGNQVFVSIPFTVTDTSAQIVNKYVVHNPKDHTPNPTPVPVPDNNKLSFINVTLTKVDAKDNNKKLADAQFEFYQCTKNDDGDLTTVGDPIKGYSANSGYNAAPTVTSFTTGQEGTVTAYHIANPAAANRSNNEVPDTTLKYVLCAKETVAPSGYTAVPYPIEVTTTDTAANDSNVSLTVKDTQQTILDIIGSLPNTGASGVILLLIIGAGLLGSGIAIRYRRQKA